MSLLTGLHGTAALLLLCSLLFLEEAGVPILILPGDAILIVGGLFIARGSLSPWLFIPAACLSAAGGASIAHGWARLVGTAGFSAMAERLHAERQLQRVSDKLEAAGPVGIAVCRLLPGLRVYTSLVVGALGISVRQFLAGAVPAIVLWVVTFTLLGVLVGVPAEHVLSRVQRAAGEGVLLIAIGIAAYLGIRHIPVAREPGQPLRIASRRYRLLLAGCLDGGIIAAVVSGLAEISNEVAGFPDIDGVVDVALVCGAILLFYVAATRRGAGGTVGEALLGVSYRRTNAA